MNKWNALEECLRIRIHLRQMYGRELGKRHGIAEHVVPRRRRAPPGLARLTRDALRARLLQGRRRAPLGLARLTRNALRARLMANSTALLARTF